MGEARERAVYTQAEALARRMFQAYLAKQAPGAGSVQVLTQRREYAHPWPPGTSLIVSQLTLRGGEGAGETAFVAWLREQGVAPDLCYAIAVDAAAMTATVWEYAGATKIVPSAIAGGEPKQERVPLRDTNPATGKREMVRAEPYTVAVASLPPAIYLVAVDASLTEAARSAAAQFREERQKAAEAVEAAAGAVVAAQVALEACHREFADEENASRPETCAEHQEAVDAAIHDLMDVLGRCQSCGAALPHPRQEPWLRLCRGCAQLASVAAGHPAHDAVTADAGRD